MLAHPGGREGTCNLRLQVPFALRAPAAPHLYGRLLMNTTELVISPEGGAIHLSGYALALRGGLKKEVVRNALADLFRHEQAMGNCFELTCSLRSIPRQ